MIYIAFHVVQKRDSISTNDLQIRHDVIQSLCRIVIAEWSGFESFELV